MCFSRVLKGVFVVVYLRLVRVLSCCLHGVIKHDDDDDNFTPCGFVTMRSYRNNWNHT